MIGLATILLALAIIDLAMVFGKKEMGLWDNMPNGFRQTLLFAYVVLLVSSYVLFILTVKIKSKLDFIPNRLFLINGLVIMLLLVLYAIELLKHL
jgi:hypothetical protein